MTDTLADELKCTGNKVSENLRINEWETTTKQKPKLIFDYETKCKSVSRTYAGFERNDNGWLDDSIDFLVPIKPIIEGSSKKRKAETLRKETETNVNICTTTKM